jgi:hypothetical protein
MFERETCWLEEEKKNGEMWICNKVLLVEGAKEKRK